MLCVEAPTLGGFSAPTLASPLPPCDLRMQEAPL